MTTKYEIEQSENSTSFFDVWVTFARPSGKTWKMAVTKYQTLQMVNEVVNHLIATS